MIVSLIVAKANNNAIGKNNDLLWHLPADMKFFRETTTGHCIITGRKNYESIPPKFRPLKNRTNIVLTRNKNYQAPETIVVNSIETALQNAKNLNESEVFIIGGGQIYKEALEKGLVDKMYITHVNTEIEGDTFFPEIIDKEWVIDEVASIAKDEKNGFDCVVKTYKRKL